MMRTENTMPWEGSGKTNWILLLLPLQKQVINAGHTHEIRAASGGTLVTKGTKRVVDDENGKIVPWEGSGTTSWILLLLPLQ